MVKRVIKTSLVSIVIMLQGLLILPAGCRNSVNEKAKIQNIEREVADKEDVINLKSFQNSDSTWGFTIFVNSMPFRHYNKIPFRDSPAGFASEKDAEKVANLFIKMIKKGDSSPQLDKKAMDTLGITLNPE
jgi:hypothetical protein